MLDDSNSNPFDAEPGRKERPVQMVYDPPRRLTVPQPRSEPVGTVSGSYGPSSWRDRPDTFLGDPHAVGRPATVDSAVPTFATNVADRDVLVVRGRGGDRLLRMSNALQQSKPQAPLPSFLGGNGAAGSGFLVRSSVLTSRLLHDPSYTQKGWVEPSIANASRTSGRRFLPYCGLQVLVRVLDYLLPEELDCVAAYVCRGWHAAILGSKRLTFKRKMFVWSGESTCDGRGILHYLGNKSRGPPKEAVRRLLPTHLRDYPESTTALLNPAMGVDPTVIVMCSRILRPVAQASRDPASMGRAVSFVSPGGPQLCVTENMPYSWVGVDFKRFRVMPTAYTIGTMSYEAATNLGATSPPLPLQWELQGCRAVDCKGDVYSLDDWVGMCSWHVLHRYECHPGESLFRYTPPAADGTPSPSHLSHTFRIDPSVTQRWGFFKRFRIVQTGRNSSFGHELSVSGFEVYGGLVLDKRGVN